MRLFLVLILLTTMFTLGILVGSTPINAQVFTRNLTLGSTGADVTSLQEFLVSKGFLQMPAGVAYGYFGPLTRAAVAQWQAANGISPAVGYFGPISRARIVTQSVTPPLSTKIPPAPNLTPLVDPGRDTMAAPGMLVNRVMLFRASPFQVRPGDFIVLDGSGFSKSSNKIHFNGEARVTASSTNGVTLEFSVPTNLSEGEYRLSVSNVLGSSENPNIKIAIKVTNNPQAEPVIKSASIIGDTVTVMGSGFTLANYLITTLGNLLSPVSASGDTLTFRITELSMYERVRQVTLGRRQAELWIYVQNENGINKEPYKLEITI